MAFCVNCGAPVNGKFCGECGTKVETVDETQKNVNSQMPAKKNYDGLKIAGFKFHRVGMSMGKFMTAIRRPDGFDIVESTNNIPWHEIDGRAGAMTMGFMGMLPMMGMAQFQAGIQAQAEPTEIIFPTEEEIYASKGMVSLVRVSEEETEAFFDSLRALGTYEWDGFTESNPLPPGVYDGQDVFSLGILFEDGSLLKAVGSNAYPVNYEKIHSNILSFFSKHQDYSRYYPKEFPNEMPSRLMIKIGSDSPNRFYAEVELKESMKRWDISLKDSHKEYVSEDVFISDAGSAEGENCELPFERFINLLKKHDMGKLNSKMEGAVFSTETEEMSMMAVYSEERSYRVMMNANKEQYKNFILEFISELKLTYEELKGTSFIK